MSIFHADEMPLDEDGIMCVSGADELQFPWEEEERLLEESRHSETMPLSENDAMPVNGNTMMQIGASNTGKAGVMSNNDFMDINNYDEVSGEAEVFDDELDVVNSARSMSSRARERIMRDKYGDHEEYDPNRMDNIAFGNDAITQDDLDKDFERNLCGKILIGLAILMAILFPSLFIIAIVHMAYTNKNPVESTTSVERAFEPIDPPPVNIDQICSNDSLQTDTGYENCLQVCQASICCEFPINLDLSCVFGNEKKCLAYHKHCVKLNYPMHDKEYENGESVSQISPSNEESAITVPEASKAIPKYCAQDNLGISDGFAICQQSCLPGECCYEKDPSIQFCTSDPNCEGYASCFAMASLDKRDTKITEEVDQKCARENINYVNGRDECLDACSHSLCCYAEDIVGPCPNDDNGSFCKQYDSCKNVFTVTKEQIDSLCDPSTGSEGTCKHLCFPARCCFDQGVCFDDVTVDDCDMYNSCVTVFPKEIDASVLPDPISPPVPSTSNPTKGPTPLPVDVSAFSTKTYPKEEIDDACLNHNNDGATNGKQTLCGIVCESGNCCFDNTIECSANMTCSAYESCPGAAVAAVELEEACSENKLQTDKTLCVQLCAPSACCFTSDLSRLCFNQGISINCNDYTSCDPIFN